MNAATVHFDTNFLIAASMLDSAPRRRIDRWLDDGVRLAISAMAWAEFRCGPVDVRIAEAWERVLGDAVVPVDRSIAEHAAWLFNRSGGRTRSLPDCLVAAVAMEAAAPLATLNRADFERFTARGLVLA